MNLVRAIIAAFLQEWKWTARRITNVSQLLGIVPPAIVITWIADQSGNPAVLSYISVGVPLMAIWNGVIFNAGWSLNNELSLFGTLEFVLISRTQLMVVFIGKTLAQIAYSIPVGIIALAMVFLMSRQLPAVTEITLLLLSLVLVIMALAVTGLLFAPLMVLVGGRSGFFNAIIPFGVALSGFYFPVDRLPLPLQVASRFLPTSWAMQSVWLSIEGPELWWLILRTWAACFLISALVFGVTYLMFKIVEKRIRITGTLGIY